MASDDKPVTGYKHAGAQGILDTFAPGAGNGKILAEKTAEDGIIEERREPLLGHYLAGIDVDHGGCGGLDQGRKGETHLLATVGNNPRRGLRCRGIGIIPSRRQRGGHAQNRSQQPRQ